MPTRWKPWPKLISLLLLVCLLSGAVAVFPTYSPLVKDNCPSCIALARGQGSSHIASRDPVRLRTKLCREHKRAGVLTATSDATASPRLWWLSFVQPVSSSDAIDILARLGRAPPSP